MGGNFRICGTASIRCLAASRLAVTTGWLMLPSALPSTIHCTPSEAITKIFGGVVAVGRAAPTAVLGKINDHGVTTTRREYREAQDRRTLARRRGIT